MKMLPLLLVVFLGSCKTGMTLNHPLTSPPKSSPSHLFWRMDPDIDALFGAKSPIEGLPFGMQFSPDGRQLAFLKKSEASTELWVHHVENNISIPLFSDPQLSVGVYRWTSSNQIVLIANGDIWRVNTEGKREKLAHTASLESDIQVSSDGKKAAYVKGHNLYVMDLATQEEIPITTEGSAIRTFGSVTWLYKEEFNTLTGFEWSPTGHRIWFFETDLKDVPFFEIDHDGNIRKVPYPKAGKTNPTIKVWTFALGEEAPTLIRDGAGRDVYIPNVVWHPKGRTLLVTELDRLQTKLDLLACPVERPQCTMVLNERDPQYVVLPDSPLFFNDGNEMLWLSASSGFRQIERIDLKSGNRIPLTTGEFEVTQINHIDETKGRVMFTANIEKVTEQKLYAVSLQKHNVMTIPQTSGTHSVIFSKDGRLMVDTHSAIDRAPKIELITTDEKSDSLFETDNRTFKSEDVHNEIISIPNREGTPLWAQITRPKTMSPDTTYPVLVITYGGPQYQLVTNRFHPLYQPLRNLLAKRGVVVFSVDGRGSAGRGHAFESASRLKLGQVELQDQLDGINYLKSLPYINSKRIGIFGWSYGGYMTLNALLREQETFSLGISVAPVTDWRHYDTAYTERYMLRPTDNPNGYNDSDLLPLAGRLKAPLLLAHGIADDNVHLVHSTRLLNAFFKKGRNVQHLFYPGKDHRISGNETRVQLLTQIVRFIEEHL